MSTTRQQREELAERIIALTKDSAYPFGGYLRDKVAGDEFIDLDLFNLTHNPNYGRMSDYSFKTLLRKAGLEVVSQGSKHIYNPITGWKLEKETFSILDPVTRAAISADVNTLWFNKMTGKVEVSPQATYSMENVMAHIAKHVFDVPADSEISGDRLSKLFRKGYKPAQLVEENNNSQAQALLGKEQKKMTTERGFMDTFKSDMEKAAYRSCGTQMTNAVKQGILLAVKNGGADEGAMIGNDPRVTRLSEEFRVAGYAQGMNLLFAALMQYVMPGIMAVLQSLPPATPSVTEADMAELTRLQNSRVRVVGQTTTVPDLNLMAEKEAMASEEMQLKGARA